MALPETINVGSREGAGDGDPRFVAWTKLLTILHALDVRIDGVSDSVSGYAPLASPALTGAPTAPTQAAGNNSTRLATTAFVKAAIDAVLAGAPGALDTLKELATALGNDANFATTVTNALAAKAPLASPTFTGTPVAPTPTAGDNSTKLATTAFVLANAPSSGAATAVRLNYTSATVLTLVGVDGNQLYVAGANRTLSSATLSNASAAASTAYYIYAAWSGSAVTLLYSTTAPAVDATTGIKFMTGDATKTLVGAAVTNASSQWQAAPLTSSYFNRRDQAGTSASVSSSTSGTASTELSTSHRVAAWVWADEALDVDVRGYGSQNTGVASHYGMMQAATDQGTLGPVSQAGGIGSTTANWSYASRVVTKPGTDGLRYGTAYGYNDGGGFNAAFTLTTIVKTRG